MAATVSGFHRGIVSNIEDPEQRGRIKCLIPDVLGKEVESAWCEPCVTVAYDRGGDFCLPNVKETIWIAFEDGNPNKPIYMGNWWQKGMTPLGANYGAEKSQVRVINYANCLITLKDSTISVNVGGGGVELLINNGSVAITGNLTVSGNINAGSINTGPITSGAINAGSLSTSGSVNSGSLSTGNITATTIQATTVNASSSVNAPNIP